MAARQENTATKLMEAKTQVLEKSSRVIDSRGAGQKIAASNSDLILSSKQIRTLIDACLRTTGPGAYYGLHGDPEPASVRDVAESLRITPADIETILGLSPKSQPVVPPATQIVHTTATKKARIQFRPNRWAIILIVSAIAAVILYTPYDAFSNRTNAPLQLHAWHQRVLAAMQTSVQRRSVDVEVVYTYHPHSLASLLFGPSISSSKPIVVDAYGHSHREFPVSGLGSASYAVSSGGWYRTGLTTWHESYGFPWTPDLGSTLTFSTTKNVDGITCHYAIPLDFSAQSN